MLHAATGNEIHVNNAKTSDIDDNSAYVSQPGGIGESWDERDGARARRKFDLVVVPFVTMFCEPIWAELVRVYIDLGCVM